MDSSGMTQRYQSNLQKRPNVLKTRIAAHLSPEQISSHSHSTLSVSKTPNAGLSYTSSFLHDRNQSREPATPYIGCNYIKPQRHRSRKKVRNWPNM